MRPVRFRACLWATLIFALCGCSGAQPPAPRSSKARPATSAPAQAVIAPFPEEAVEVELVRKDHGLQARFWKGYTRGGIDEAAARETLRQLYEHFRADIEQTQPRAKEKKIHLVLGTCRLESERGMAFAEVDSGALERTLPVWEQVTVKIQPRDLATRPSWHDELLYLGSLAQRRDARDQVESRFRNARGFVEVPADRLLEVEAEVDVREEQMLQDYATKLGTTREELERVDCKWIIWTRGRPATEAAIDAMMK